MTRFIFGTLAVFFARMHYRWEVRPYARRAGHDRAAVRQAAASAVLRIFDKAWPEKGGGE
jgi:hypothetical protein